MGDPLTSLCQLEEEICTCGICSDTCRRPRALPCLHSFCRECLEQHIQDEVKKGSKAYFLCPSCKQPTDLPKNVRIAGRYSESFREDSFIDKVCEVIAAYGADKSCDLCVKRGDDVPALNWCLDCYQAICDACTSIHLHDDVTADHVVISLPEMQKLPLESVMTRKRVVPCAKHVGESLTLYCTDCKEPACGDCAALSHRKCRSCLPVADAVSAKEEDMAEVVIRLQSMPPQGMLGGGFGDAMEVLEETVRSSKERIRAVAAELRQKIDDSEKELLMKVDDAYAMLKEKIDSKGGPAKDYSKILRAGNERMQYLLKYGSDVEILQVYDTIKDAMAKMERSGNNNGNEEEEEELMFRVNFMPDDVIKVFQRDYQTMGHVQVEDCNSDDGLSSWGVTCTSRDEIIVVDCRNRRMQKFTSNGDLIDHIQISEEPRDVTCLGKDDDVAITIMKKLIFIVTVSGTMALKRRIRTAKQYDAIAYSSTLDQFLVSCLQDTSVDVINQSGDVVKSFNVDSAGNAIFVEPRYVTFTGDGNYVVTDVATNTVKCISPEGRLLFAYQPSGAHVLRKPQGLCIDNIGNIFVADYGNSRIQLVTSEGAFQRFVLARESGIHRPVAIYMSSTSKLVVVQSDGIVKVFSYE
ncbi:hypothetical protein C0Q70_12825 [Pomacea canaliculata]|uniref:RING-type domain-containing protein n=1 Tax=Pomacea canaliculata TaxID=400727 RepID=A0A2T7P2M5_POMCA|nr:tripartite motif-containing protein 3-like [Pomacea canaliculata]PVD27658.1 hypothetical protein C0Q70_12825 [Pomacea canaliculata]